MSVWEADALLSLGGAKNFRQAQNKLDTAIEQVARGLLEISGGSGFEVKQWHAHAVQAFAYRVRGYLQRVRGSMQAAIEDYRRAAALWRQVNLQIELALTLNNMAFALSELGYWADARALAEEALALRYRLGPRSPVGLSLNTLALIDIQEGAYTSAIKGLESALALFRALSNEGDAGLALIALADAQRRHAGTALVPTPEEKVAVLRAACESAREALTIFTNLGEVPRQIEALINLGIARRDWLRIRRVHAPENDDIGQLFTESEAALRSAAELAGDAIRYRNVDALLSLAWLYFFAGRDDLIDNATLAVEQAIPVDYRINQEHGRPGITS